MMNRTVSILLLALLVATGTNVCAQRKAHAGTHKKDSKKKKHKKIVFPEIYLGHSDIKGGPVR